MGEITEKQVRDGCLSRAKKLGLLHKRMHFGHGAAAGWPDDLFVTWEGAHIWVEFKRPGGEASPLQKHVHEQMRERGCIVAVVDSGEKFTAVLDKILLADV